MLTKAATNILDDFLTNVLQRRREKIAQYVITIKDRTQAGRRVSDYEISRALDVHVAQRANTVASWKMGQIKRASDRHFSILRLLAKGVLVLVDTGEFIDSVTPKGQAQKRRIFTIDIKAETSHVAMATADTTTLAAVDA